MSAEDNHRDLIRALDLAWALECGISWHDVTEEKRELHELMWKHHAGLYNPDDPLCPQEKEE